MGIINTESAEALNLEGLHLYHHAMSNCSQKVRLCLEEKGLEWSSHHVDLVHNEHFTPEYVAINPKGQVPTLIHDGVVVIESSDIIDYLDRTFPEQPLRPNVSGDLELMYRWLRLWDDTQIHLKNNCQLAMIDVIEKREQEEEKTRRRRGFARRVVAPNVRHGLLA
jgi:glutathione S-transferase